MTRNSYPTASCVKSTAATAVNATVNRSPPTSSTRSGGAIRSTFIFTDTPTEKTTQPITHRPRWKRHTARYANAMAKQSLNSRRTKMLCTRLLRHSVSSAHGGTHRACAYTPNTIAR